MELKDKILELLTKPVADEGFDIVELKLSRFKQSSRLQFFVDSENGVKLDDCVRLTRMMEPLIDAEELFKYDYVVEVSSPGLDRPLQTARDFRRRIGETVEISFNDDEIAPLKGELLTVDEKQIELVTSDGNNKFDLADVKAGKIIF